MSKGCPCGRDCTSCPYESICGGCLGNRCVHKSEASKKTENKCLFSDLQGLDCTHGNLKPPSKFQLAEPSVLEEMIEEYEYCDIGFEPQRDTWPILIPEVSHISPTTTRLGLWENEGDWANPFFDPIAWDMTGTLFDKARGAPWVHEPTECGHQDWREVLGPEKNWINDVLLIDRLPDYLAMQTPPSTAIILYLNRLQIYYPTLLSDDDAPYPWLVTHGYPSYTDWPPAWHFNLGIRMLSSLLAYLICQDEGYIPLESGALYPDGSRRTTQNLPLPYFIANGEKRLLWNPSLESMKFTEMEWPRFPGIIPFIPGADTNQLSWFGEMMVKAGFTTLAIDGLNSIAHENFKGLPAAISALRQVGAKRVMNYGPWPLHIPATNRPIHGISYIVSASHMDLTNTPPRFWRRTEQDVEQQGSWKELPSYKTTRLSSAKTKDWLEICSCKACTRGSVSETNPRSIYLWSHLLHAGIEWVLKVQDIPEKDTEISEENECLWMNGPSNTTFRKCIHYPKNSNCEPHQEEIQSLRILSTGVDVRFSDELTGKPHEIRWGWKSSLYNWADGFPELES